MIGCTRSGGQGVEGEDDPDLTVGWIRYTEPCDQEGGCHHVADAAHFELCPVVHLDSMLELCQHVITELCEDQRHGFGRHLRPELVGCTEQCHQGTSRSVHVQDAGGGGKYNHAGVGRRMKGLLHRICSAGACPLQRGDTILRRAGLVLRRWLWHRGPFREMFSGLCKSRTYGGNVGDAIFLRIPNARSRIEPDCVQRWCCGGGNWTNYFFRTSMRIGVPSNPYSSRSWFSRKRR